MILYVALLLSFDAESYVYFVVFIFLTTYLTLIELCFQFVAFCLLRFTLRKYLKSSPSPVWLQLPPIH